ncbi:MAG: hypothetical protein KBD51_01190 [Candidatus Levybacteria bacterium]|nr:hypothetical protein [Candidatus Levybacteria bacterium]
MVNPYTVIIFSLIVAIATLSPAQIRYAVTDPIGSLNVFLNLGIILVIIAVYYFYRKSNQNSNSNEDYSLVGTKGGRATKIKTRRRKNRQV